jgi:hypothetical protein
MREKTQADLEEARFLLELLELGLDPMPAPDVPRFPSNTAAAATGRLHRRRRSQWT